MKMRLLALASAVLLMSCNLTDPPDAESSSEVERGVLKHYRTGPFITRPESVRVDEEFTVSVKTFSSRSPALEKVETRVSVEDRQVLIEPFNRSLPHPGIEPLPTIWHHATLTFSTPGAAKVIVRGMSWPEESPYESVFRIEVVE